LKEVPYGARTLASLYADWATTGMIANIGARIVDVSPGSLVLEATMAADRHSFPTSRGPIVHGGAIATLVDEALASVAYTLADETEATTTSSLHVDYYRPAPLGRLTVRANVRHRTRRLAYCHATVEDEAGRVVAEGRGVMAYVRE
jgi:uncharacterized protein (TIGR00369 family)